MNSNGPITKIEMGDMKAVFKLRSKFANDVHLHLDDKPENTGDKIVRYIRGHISDSELREALDEFDYRVTYLRDGVEVEEAKIRFYESDPSKPDLPWWNLK
jgi:hypothetical protein